MPPKNRKQSSCPVPVAFNQHTNKMANKIKKKPDWDDTVHDLSVYKATKDDLLKRKLLHQSSNSQSVKDDILQKKIMQVIKKNSISTKGVFRKIVHSEDDESHDSDLLKSPDLIRNNQMRHTTNVLKDLSGKENKQNLSNKNEQKKESTHKDENDCVVRILNDFKYENDSKEDDDDDINSIASSKSFLSHVKNSVGQSSLRNLFEAVFLMSDNFEEVKERLNEEVERRRQVEERMEKMNEFCHSMHSEMASLKHEISVMRTEIQELKAVRCTTPSFTHNQLLNLKDKPPHCPAIPLVAPKQGNSPLFHDSQNIKSFDVRSSNPALNTHSIDDERLKQEQIAELNRRREEKLRELNMVLLMEKSVQEKIPSNSYLNSTGLDG